MITPFDEFVYLINHVVLGGEPSLEDFILLIGTVVAFIAFVLWCCFPVIPKDEDDEEHRLVIKRDELNYTQRIESNC